MTPQIYLGENRFFLFYTSTESQVCDIPPSSRVFRYQLLPPSLPPSLSHSLPSSFNLSPSPSPDRPSHQCPFPSVWLVPFLFTQMTLPPPRSFCLSGSPLPRCPPTTAHPVLSLLYISVSLFSPSVSSSLSSLSVSNSVSCLLSPSVSLFLVCSHCTDAWLGLQQLSRHVPLPSVAYDCTAELGGGGGGGGGCGLGVEGTEWIGHEYSCSLVCTTKQKMAPQWRLHPSQKKKEEVGGEDGGRKGRRKHRGRRIGNSLGTVMEEYGKWRQTERGEGDQTEWQGSTR